MSSSNPSDAAKAERLRAKALARWEGEGGTLGQPAQSLDEGELRILARLGAALLCEWESLPEPSRTGISTLAARLHAQRDAERIRLLISRYVAEQEAQ